MGFTRFRLLIGLLSLACIQHGLQSTIYFVDSSAGSDQNDGISTGTAWKTLERAGKARLQAGDAIRLKRGAVFQGSLKITGHGSRERPIGISSYGEGPLPVIDASGYPAGIQLLGARHIVVEDLEITGDGGAMVDGSPEGMRSGVLVKSLKGKAVSDIVLRKLHLHDIYPDVGREHEGRNQSTHLGYGVLIRGIEGDGASGFVVEDCRIERTGFKAIEMKHVRAIRILNNRMKDIGGPAIQPGNVENLVVRGNVVDGSGSSLDPRMHGRGSGIWPWTSKNILIEKNTFMRARGKADSCGIHIDFNCSDVVVQYNLSIDNEGGFIEILGNNHNCAYRYNISINDGARVKGRDGAHQEGKLLWTSGYVGRDKRKTGPFNSYIYNNTIYVGPESRSCFSISGTTEGLLVANNIFHVMGETLDVLGDQDWRRDALVEQIPRAAVRNNLVLRAELLPDSLPVEYHDHLVGNPRFKNPGGHQARDYIPGNAALVKDRGIRIEKLPGDTIGLRMGLDVETDILGNRVVGPPDLGAIEISSAVP